MNRATEYVLTYRVRDDEGRHVVRRFEFFADSRDLALDHARRLCTDRGWSMAGVLRERHKPAGSAA